MEKAFDSETSKVLDRLDWKAQVKLGNQSNGETVFRRFAGQTLYWQNITKYIVIVNLETA